MENRFDTWDWQQPRTAEEYLHNNCLRRAERELQIDRATDRLLSFAVGFMSAVLFVWAYAAIGRC